MYILWCTTERDINEHLSMEGRVSHPGCLLIDRIRGLGNLENRDSCMGP